MILALLLAAAVPPVAEPDPTAPFQGDNRPVKFNPACRDYNIETVQTAPACAARVAKGETAPSLAIAAQTLQMPGRRRDAVAIVERAIKAEDHPAAHYALGNMLGTTEFFQPDYRRAVTHLTIASDRGNPLASDLLATLVLAGKGAPRDVARAIRLYERAMADGYSLAASHLALLYLQGVFVPKDEELARGILAAAEAVGDQRAAALKAMADNAAKVRNVQLVPADQPAQVSVREFGPFDNPAIPPSFGFDEAFQKVHNMPYGDQRLLAELSQTAAVRPTPYLFELARRQAATYPDLALRNYLIARIRIGYDARRCADPAAVEAIRAWDKVTIPGHMSFLFLKDNIASLRRAAAAALIEEAKMPADTKPWWVCYSGMAAMFAATNGKSAAPALKPIDEWPALRAAARRPIEELAAAQ